MSFSRYFKLSSYCLIASGFIAIAAAGSIGYFWGCFYGAALTVSGLINTEALNKRIPVWLLNLAVLGYMPFAILDYRVFSRSLILTIIHVVLYIAALKLMTLSNDRDYVYLYSISFAQLLAASTLTVDVAFAFALLAFLLSSVSTLVLFEMRRSNARALRQGVIQPVVVPCRLQGTGQELFSGFPAWRMAGLSLAMTLSVLLLAVPLFIFLPRLAIGVYGRPSGRTQMLSGFSERVELGMIGTIKESDAVVMRVRPGESPSALPVSLKWRGIALDYFDGRAWSRGKSGRGNVPASGEYFRLETSIQGTQLLEQTFFLEAISTDVVFAGHKVLAISSDLGVLRRDDTGNLFTLAHSLHKIRYKAISDITPPNPEMIPTQPYPIPEAVRSAYLQVPDLDPRIAELAKDVSRTVSHPFEKARRIEAYLRNKYAYSLELRGSPNSRDPLSMFLFDVRRGHCEYFASAMTVMLRQIGIPARLVNGFRTGEYNRLGDSFTVRQYDAHSWVEAWFQPYGWVEFDPTPPDPRHPKPAFAGMVSDFVEAIGLWWWEGVVNYDVWKQYRVINAARANLLSFQRRLRERLAATLGKLQTAGEDLRMRKWPVLSWLLLLPPICILGALALCGFRLHAAWAARARYFIRTRLLRRGTGEQVTEIYREALGLLKRRGFTRSTTQTPMEFAGSLHGHPAATTLAELTSLYYQLRFGPPRRDAGLARAESLLGCLREILRPHPRKWPRRQNPD